MMRIFKPIEVQAMLSGFMAREITHIESYSLFTETIGLPNSIYSDFLDVPVMNNKAMYLEKAKIKKFEDYKTSIMTNIEVDRAYRRDVARMIAVYAGGTEFISLLSQFAMLLKFQFQGKYPGLCDIVTFSIRDETMHGIANSALFRDFIAENSDIWDDSLKFDIYQAIREIVAYEKQLVDYFNPPHMSHEDLKTYIEYRADIALKELGMQPNYNVAMPASLEFMNDATNVMLVDFFSSTVSEYTKSVEGNFNEVDYSKWIL